MVTRVTVVGAGIMGLSTAVQIQSELPGADVVIVADRYLSQTTSDGAAGIFLPSDRFHTIPKKLALRWIRDSFDHVRSLSRSPEAGRHGVEAISGYHLSESPLVEPFAKEFFEDFHWLSEKDISRLGLKTKYGYFCTTFVASPHSYMPWLVKRFEDNGGRFETRKVKSFEEFIGKCDILVNCTGLNSRWLVNDPEVFASRGQIIRINAPWIKHFYFYLSPSHVYILPTADGVVLTGSRTPGDYDTKYRKDEATEIMESTGRVVPSVKNAPVMTEWVGLRPERNEPRVEKELLHFPSGKLRVVHNYGHGSDGICLSWGTSKYAARLVREMVQEAQVVAKL